MRDFSGNLVPLNGCLLDAVTAIERSKNKIALIVDEHRRLHGTVTDGDVRRALLRGADLNSPVCDAMNPKPRVARPGFESSALLELVRKDLCRDVPIVDESGCVVGLHSIQDLVEQPERDNPVLIMAGGVGSRLMPITENQPKPLLTVGDRPILEIILDNLKVQGFRRLLIAINYLGDKIRDYFGDGGQWGLEIEYLMEKSRLGTAGPLSLLKDELELPIVVMNGDLLTRVDIRQLLDFHIEAGAAATMCVRSHVQEVPFGVVELDNHHHIASITEKPTQRHLVNAGIYVLEPDVVASVPKDRSVDMPEIFVNLIGQKSRVAAFPIREYWLDIGRIEDLRRANDEYYTVFGAAQVARIEP